MSRRLTVALCLALAAIVVVVELSGVIAAEETREAQIGELREQIQEIERALERDTSEAKIEELRGARRERVNRLERLMAGADKREIETGEFPEIELGIRRAKGQLGELRHAAEELQESGAAPDRLEKLEGRIEETEAQLEEFYALWRSGLSGEGKRMSGRRKSDSFRGRLRSMRMG